MNYKEFIDSPAGSLIWDLMRDSFAQGVKFSGKGDGHNPEDDDRFEWVWRESSETLENLARTLQPSDIFTAMVRGCSACGQDHGILFHALKQPDKDNQTHWGTCQNTMQPVFLGPST